MNNVEFKIIEFLGSQLSAATVDGVTWVSVKPICTALGIANNGQQEKIKADSRFNYEDIFTVGADGRTRAMFCINLEHLNVWLFMINSNKVAASKKARLFKFQSELMHVIDMYCRTGSVTRAEVQEDMEAEATAIAKREVSKAVPPLITKAVQCELAAAEAYARDEESRKTVRSMTAERTEAYAYAVDQGWVLGVKQPRGSSDRPMYNSTEIGYELGISAEALNKTLVEWGICKYIRASPLADYQGIAVTAAYLDKVEKTKDKVMGFPVPMKIPHKTKQMTVKKIWMWTTAGKNWLVAEWHRREGAMIKADADVERHAMLQGLLGF